MTTFLVVLIGWLLAVCFHEFGHAVVAYNGDDTTVKSKGYLSFNPLKYAHPVYSLAMPIVFLLLGGIPLPGAAVYIRDDLLRSKAWRTAVSLAGPGASLLATLALCIPLWMGLVPASPQNPVSCAVAFLVLLQALGIILNLLPIPPLDGFRAISPWLPATWRRFALEHSGVALVVFFLLLWRVPPVNQALWGTAFRLTLLLGIDMQLVASGAQAFEKALSVLR